MTGDARDGRRADVLIMAAHGLELASLRVALGADSHATVQGCAVALREVGVGAMSAGGGAMRALHDARPKAALLVGSCGVYPGHDAREPGQLLVASRLVAVDAAVLGARAAFPAPMATGVEADPALGHALFDAAQSAAPRTGVAPPFRGALATTLAITTDDALAAQLGRDAGCVAENLEALAVALSCGMQGVAFAAVVAVTNDVGSNGRAQWREHHPLAARAAADCVLAWLERATAGGR